MPNSSTPKVSPLMVAVAFGTVYLVWGSTYFFIQRAIHGFPPLLLGAVRFLTAGFILITYCIAKKEKIRLDRNLLAPAISGLLLLFVGNGVVIWVEQYLPSAMVAIMVSSSPLWFVLLDRPKWKENMSSQSTVTGLIIGFLGVIILFSEKISAVFAGIAGRKELVSLLLLVIGSMCWAGGSLYSKYRSSNMHATVNTSWQMLFAGLAFLPASIISGEMKEFHLFQVGSGAWLALLYLIFFGSIAAFSAYVWLLKVRPATQVSTYAYVNPVVAVMLGVFLAGENISPRQIIGLFIILASVLLINLSKYRSGSPSAMKLAGSRQ